MKKSLLALAVLGAFTGAAFAQTSVTVYGVVDMGYQNDNGSNAAGSINSLVSGGQSGSRLGFKGTEDLGGGLSAIFTLENGFKSDDGSIDSSAAVRPLFGRQAFVGLQGGFGVAKLGRQYTPLYNATVSYDPFAAGLAGDYRRVILVGGQRVDNAIVYGTPTNLGGFNAEALYALGEVAGDNAKGRHFGLSVGYANGPVSVKLAHHNGNSNPAAPGAIVSTKSTALGGSYDFKVVKVSALYQTNKDDTAGANLDTRDWLVGVSAPFGASTVLASYIRHINKATSDADSNQIAIGYTYALSKRTNLYTSYARLVNDNKAKIATDTNGATDKLFNVGIRHTF